MKRTLLYLFVVVFVLHFLSTFSEHAYAWSNDPKVNTPICTADHDQWSPMLISDGVGGAIITWYDQRSGSDYDIYAQRLNGSGVPQWTTNGVAICTATEDQKYPTLTIDGSGGAIITWQDYRSGTSWDIYARRINASGSVKWTTNGVAICIASNHQEYPTITSDNAGGAIITWHDNRNSNYDIYARRVNEQGATQWTANGVAICIETGNQYDPTIISDGSGGAIITWDDCRGGITNCDIYAQRVTASGNIPFPWPTNGAPICEASYNQWNATITTDGAGGAIISWEDFRSGSGWDIYAQRISGFGSVKWMPDGPGICWANNHQQYPAMTTDGAGGAIITWQDYRSGNYDIYVQRVTAAGAKQWTINGVPICTQGSAQQYPTITSDGSGGAIIAWIDYRNGSTDIYAQRVTAGGVPLWKPNGVAICTASNNQWSPTLISDGVGGAIITWYDQRSGNYDIYAQRIYKDGTLGDFPWALFYPAILKKH